MSSSAPELWFRRYHSSPDAAATLVCFPHAGGSASYYYPMSAALAPGVDVLAVQYPGRQDRRTEPMLPTIGALADAVHATLPPLAGPVAFFGHSMGAAVAFEVARRCEAAGDIRPVMLFASGCRAPSRERDDGVHRRDDDGIVAELRGMGGTDARVLSEVDLLELVLPPLRNDYRAIETYTCAPDVRIAAPISILVAVDDDRATVQEAEDWHRHTIGGSSITLFDGGHFYLERHAAQVIALVTEILRDPPVGCGTSASAQPHAREDERAWT